jgi:hypothetical protein
MVHTSGAGVLNRGTFALLVVVFLTALESRTALVESALVPVSIMSNCEQNAPASGNIRGRIVRQDSSGPVYGLRVNLIQRKYRDDARAYFATVRSAFTNMRGAFEFVDTKPGVFFIGTDAMGKSTDLYLPQYYPQASEISHADPVNISPGQDKTVDLAVVPTRPVRILGRFVDGLGKRLAHADWLSGVTNDRRLYYRNAETFEINEVTPGFYYLRSLRIDDIQHRAETVIPLLVRDSDIQVDVVSTQSFSITGWFRVDGIASTLGVFRGSDIKALRIRLYSADDPDRVNVFASPEPNGRFTFISLPAGSYRLTVIGLPALYYIKSASLGLRDTFDNGVNVPGDAAEHLDIHLGNDGGVLRGSVLDTNNTVVPHAYVVLVPRPGNLRRPDLYKATRSDYHGGVTIAGIAPGNYRAFALPRFVEGLYFDEALLKHQESCSVMLSIGANESLNTTLPMATNFK